MNFEIIGEIEDTEVIAVNHKIRDKKRLEEVYGEGRWRKLKGIATIKLKNGTMHEVELHWYEANGIGRKELKVKYFLKEIK